MDNVTNNGTEQAAGVAKEKYTYHDVLEILSGLTEEEMKELTENNLDIIYDMFNYDNNGINGFQKMISVYEDTIKNIKTKIEIMEKLDKLTAKKNEADAERQEKKEANKSVNWYYPSLGYDYGRRNPYGYTSVYPTRF